MRVTDMLEIISKAALVGFMAAGAATIIQALIG